MKWKTLVQIFKLVAVVALLWSPITAQAQDFASILEAEEAGHYAEAMDMLSVLAKQGDARAQNKLGFMYESGRGGWSGYQSDLGYWSGDIEALRWYRVAAEQNNAEAQAGLGFMYETGRAVPQDFTEAARWFRMAAEQGDVRAQANLGFMYENGRGVPQSDIEATKWFRMAAEQGDSYAQSSLRSLSENGRGALLDSADALQALAIDWSSLDVDAKRDLNTTLVENNLFQADEELPDGYLWQEFGISCSFSLREREIIQSLVYLRADVIPVVFRGYYGTHSDLKQEIEERFLEVAHYMLFDRADLVQRYRPATIAFNFYRQQIDDILNRDAVLAEIDSLFDGSRPSINHLDENGYQLDNFSIALSKLNLEPYPNACLRSRNDNYGLSLEDWIISFWVRRSVEGNYDFAKQAILALTNLESGSTYR